MFIEAIERAAQMRGDSIATACGDRLRTWAASADRTARLANALSARGIGPGTMVGILAQNSDRYLEAMHATWWCGAVTVPMNTRWALAEHLYSIDDAGIAAIFVDDAFLDVVAQIVAERPIAVLVHMGEGPTPQRFSAFEALVEETPPRAPHWQPATALAGIFYTGGTTGFPKGVMHSFASLWAGSTCLATDAQVPAHPRYLHAAPMFHLGDLSHAYYTTAKAGTHVFVPGFAPGPVCTAVRQHEVNAMLLVPTMIGMLLDSPEFRVDDFASLQVLMFGGSPISDAVLGRLRSALPHVHLLQGFGQTETNACGTLMPDVQGLAPEDPRRRSTGRALYGVQLGIFDERGVALPTGETGEIWIRAPSAMLGYWRKPEQTAATLTDGWVHTGDAGYLDAGGFLYVCDRVKDMIITGGENVYSAEVENAIASHPAVVQVAVIGVPDDRWGEHVHAVIVVRSPLSLEVLQAHCRPLIAGYKLPRSLELRSEPLPLSPVGKVLKTVLRAPHWGNRDRRVN